MGFRLINDYEVRHDVPLIDIGLQAYDTLADDSFDLNRDGLLEQRSAYELVRDQLSDAQRAELDLVDTHWRANATAFNRAFAVMHGQKSLASELKGRVEDDAGKIPAIPRSHWWWWPLTEGEE